MSKNLKENGGPAFPSKIVEVETHEAIDVLQYETGMTLRDYFAAKAMSGFCSREDLTSDDYADMIRQSYQLADAMLKARSL
jgi:hypothetical protein